MADEKIITLIPDLIPESTKEEALNPSANLLGQALRGVLHLILDPFVKLNVVRNQELLNFEQKIISKNDEIPIENRDDSKKHLALKAIEDAKFQLGSEELREMFANLISSTLDSRKNNLVQPSFSSILRDLSTEDAQTLLYFSPILNKLPIVSIRFSNLQQKIGVNIIDNIILLNNDTIHRPHSLSSLMRLGLISINQRKLRSQGNIALYHSFKSSDIYKSHESQLPIDTDEIILDEISVVEQSADLTPLGENFLKAVIYS